MLKQSSRDRMLAALNCQTPDHPPCSFMIFGALLEQSGSYFDFIDRQLAMGLDACVMIPPRPPVVRNDHCNLYGLPVPYAPEVTVEEYVSHPPEEEHPVLVKIYHTPAGDLTTEVRQTEDWRWGEHVPFLDDFLIPRSKKFIVESPDDLPALQYLLVRPKDEEVADFQRMSAPAMSFAKQRDLLITGGWGVGMDMIGWIHGLHNLIFDVYDRPEFIQQLFSMISEWNRQRMAVVLDAGIDLFIKRAWYENTDFFSPSIWEKLIQPELRKDAALAHQAGAKLGYIITANAMPLLDMIADAGVDVIIGVDPQTYDLQKTKKILAGMVALWGGVNGHQSVEHGPSELVEQETLAALQSMGPDGFILSPVDNVREHTPQAIRNVTTLIDTWQGQTDQK